MSPVVTWETFSGGTLFIPYIYIGDKQCRGTLNGPYITEEAIYNSVVLFAPT